MKNQNIMDSKILLDKIESYKATFSNVSLFLNEVYQTIDTMTEQAMDYADSLENKLKDKETEIINLKKLINSLEERNEKYEALLNELQNKEIIK